MSKKIGENSGSAITSDGDYGTIAASIEGAVDMVLADESNKDGQEPEKKGPTASAPEEHTPETPDDGGEEKAFEVGDAEIERAVRAGLTVADARSFKDKDAFERVCSALEKRSSEKPKEEAEPDGDEGDGNPADDDIPTLPDDEDYDEKLVKVVNSLGSMVRELRKENRELRKAGESAKAQSFFDTQYDGLDEAVRTKAGADGRAKVQAKFRMLEAGYKAMKADVPREDIFKEAAQLAIGGLLGENAAATKAAKIESRKGLKLAQPGGESRPGDSARSGEDAERDVARLVAEKFGIPKN